MRLRVLALAIAGVLASAGAAAAEDYNGYAVNAPAPPESFYVSQSSGGPASDNSDRRQRYLWRLQSLQEWAFKLKANDGGKLSAQHIAILLRQLDKLNHIYGKG